MMTLKLVLEIVTPILFLLVFGVQVRNWRAGTLATSCLIGDQAVEHSSATDEGLELILDLHPYSYKALTTYAANADRAGNLANSAARWRLFRERYPKDANGYVREADALRAMGRLKEADEVLTKAFSRFPKNWWVAKSWAMLPCQAGDCKTALKRCERTRRLHSTEAEWPSFYQSVFDKSRAQ